MSDLGEQLLASGLCRHGTGGSIRCNHCIDEIERLRANLAQARRERDEAYERAAKVAESYEPRCDSCPRGVATAIRALATAARW